MYGNREPVEFQRDCEAVQVPDGTPVTISRGTGGRLTQALGGSFTVVTDYGQMFRIDGRNADAIGKDPSEFQTRQVEGGNLEDQIWAELATCYDPEIPIDIVELGLVYHCQVSDLDDERKRVDIKMTLTAPGCGMGDVLKTEVADKVRALPGVAEVDVEIVFDPPWDQSMMSEAARLQTGLM